MMLKRIGLLSIVVFLLTCSFAIDSSNAYPDWSGASEEDKQKWADIKLEILEIKELLKELKDQYKYPHSVLRSLNHQWDNDMAKIEDGKNVIVGSAASAIISSIAAAATAPASGGVSIGILVLSNLSIVKNGYDAGQAASEILSVNKGEYFSAYSRTFSAISEIDMGISYYYSLYMSAYEDYMSMMLDHHTGLLRLDLTQDPPTEFPYESDAFFQAVNGFTKSEAYSVTSRSTFTTTGWYHSPGGSSSGVGQNHRVTQMRYRSYYNELLEKNYACQNDDCKHNATFSTPYEAFTTHGTRCEGCGDVYYSCTTAEKYAEALERHKLRVCNRHTWESAHTIPYSRRVVDCPGQYRNCTRLKKKHIDANA